MCRTSFLALVPLKTPVFLCPRRPPLADSSFVSPSDHSALALVLAWRFCNAPLPMVSERTLRGNQRGFDRAHFVELFSTSFTSVEERHWRASGSFTGGDGTGAWIRRRCARLRDRFRAANQSGRGNQLVVWVAGGGTQRETQGVVSVSGWRRRQGAQEPR